MQKKKIRRVVKVAAATIAVLSIALVVHIYVVTHKPVDKHMVAMARIDIRQDIDAHDADVISEWLYRQEGVDHVLCNPATNIAVFTFYPARVKADDIVGRFCNSSGYTGVRYMPDAKEMMKGCPVSAGKAESWLSAMYKRVSFFH